MAGPTLRAVLIAGPTASGKSALALDLAERLGGVVVNADSMQIYEGLRILTARPSAAEEARAPHRLYGHVDPARPFSVADWLADVENLLEGLRPRVENPVRDGGPGEPRVTIPDVRVTIPPLIFVGGTGLYFESLLNGLAPVPEVHEEIRLRWRERAEAVGAAGLHRELEVRDPVMAARLGSRDTQRLTRALEVIEATGRSLADWQAAPHTPPLVAADTAVKIVLEPERAVLHERVETRFRAMVKEGAVEEAAAFAARGLSPSMPATRAIGVAALAQVAAGAIDLEEGIRRSVVETRQYVKRQSTWFRGRMGGWLRGTPQDLAETAVAAIGRTG